MSQCLPSIFCGFSCINGEGHRALDLMSFKSRARVNTYGEGKISGRAVVARKRGRFSARQRSIEEDELFDRIIDVKHLFTKTKIGQRSSSFLFLTVHRNQSDELSLNASRMDARMARVVFETAIGHQRSIETGKGIIMQAKIIVWRAMFSLNMQTAVRHGSRSTQFLLWSSRRFEYHWMRCSLNSWRREKIRESSEVKDQNYLAGVDDSE